MSIQALENAARSGDAQAQLQLGIALMTGQGVPTPDVDRGRDWLARSADGGNADAQRFLGMIYLRGMDVVPDYGKAVDCLQSAASSGDAESAWWLACIALTTTAINRFSIVNVAISMNGTKKAQAYG